MAREITEILVLNRYFAENLFQTVMIIFKKATDIIGFLHEKAVEKQIGFVPTMGALHEGHLSLIRLSKQQTDLTVCSIFVNPTQFNDKKDFEKYPSTIDQDILLLIKEGCDVLFLPSVDEIYPNGMESNHQFELGHLNTILEAAFRKGHFNGVAQVVSRLLNIVQPHHLFLGQKDFQQCMVIKKLLKIENKNVQLHICPTLREPDGLAMSSRNLRLNDAQRKLAGVVYQCLVSIASKKEFDSFEKVKKECLELLAEKGFEPDYVSLATADDLHLLEEYDNSQPMVALIAAKIGDVRLIDNLRLQ